MTSFIFDLFKRKRLQFRFRCSGYTGEWKASRQEAAEEAVAKGYARWTDSMWSPTRSIRVYPNLSCTIEERYTE